MRHQERLTPINDITSVLINKSGPIKKDTYAVATIVNRITKSKRKLKPWNPPSFCQYPNSPRTDEFSFSKGLGQVSLQPVIDKLNAFKQAAIMAIKVQFNAMGPEGTKDSKLALGAVEFLKNIYEAAKCFTKMVQNVNNLVLTYIQVINKLVIEVIQTITRLEREAMILLNTLMGTPPALRSILTVELADALDRATNIYEIIGLISSIEQELNKAMLETKTLLNTDRRIMLHFQANFALLKNTINALLYYGSLRDLLQVNLRNAKNSYMTDDFLVGLDLSAISAASYNFSITNVAGLYDYNMKDEFNIITHLNGLFKQYDPTTNNSKPLVIASRTESGYIVVPDAEQGLISCGIDPDLHKNVGLVLELSINNGDTLIRSIARSVPPIGSETLIHRNLGVYVSKDVEKIEYNKVIPVNTNIWQLVLVNNNVIPSIGDLYYFKDPMTQEPWNFYFDEVITNPVTHVVTHKYHYFPIVFKVTDTTHNSVTVERLDESTFNREDYGFTSTNINPVANTLVTIPGDLVNYTGQYVICGKLKDTTLGGYNYIVVDASIDPESLAYGPILDGKSYKTVKSLGLTNPVDDTAALIWSGTVGGITYRILQTTLYSLSLTKYNLPFGNNSKDIPHTGEKIPCLNWALTVYPYGDKDAVNSVAFSRQFPGQSIAAFFLKAHWGFIPEQLDILTKVDAEDKAKSKAVTKNLFGS